MWGSDRQRREDADRERGAAAMATADGRFDEAERAARTALKLRERISDEETPAIAEDAVALAKVLAARDSRAEANALYHRALTIYRRYERQYDAAGCLLGLACLHADTEPALSRERLRLALWIKRAALGGIHPEVLEILDAMAELSGLSGTAAGCR